MDALKHLLIVCLAIGLALPAQGLTVNGPLNNASLEPLASDPATQVREGRTYFNTADKKAKIYNGTDWTELGAGGSGQGEKNYVTNPSGAVNTTGWTAVEVAGAGTITVSRVTSGLPRATTTATGLSFAGGDAGDYVQTCWTVDDSDQPKKLRAQVSKKPGGTYATGDFKLQVYSFASASCGSTATIVSESSIPAGDSDFTHYFDTTSADHYGLRVTRVAGTSTLVLSDVIAGATAAKAVIPPSSDWTTCTTPASGWFVSGPSSNTTVACRVKQTGDTADIHYRVTFSSTSTGSYSSIEIRTPSGITIDSSKLDVTGSRENVRSLGSFYTGTNLPGMATAVGNDTQNSFLIRAVNDASGTTLEPWTGALTYGARDFTNADVGSTSAFLDIMIMDVPVLEWAGSSVNLVTSESMGSPFVYTFTTWNPSSTGNVDTDPTAGSVTSANADITASAVSTGTVTFTLNRTGYYRATMNVQHEHSGQTYSQGQFNVTIGGTATRRGLGDTAPRWAIRTSPNDGHESHSIVLQATAVGQTFTFRPTLATNALGGTAAQHAGKASVIIEPLSTLGQSLGFNEGTSTVLGLRKKNKYVQRTVIQNGSNRTFAGNSTGATSSDLLCAKFDNLNTSKRYRLSFVAEVENKSANAIQIDASLKVGASQTAALGNTHSVKLQSIVTSASSGSTYGMSGSYVFTPTAGTVIVVGNSGNLVQFNPSNNAYSNCSIEELEDELETTTAFD